MTTMTPEQETFLREHRFCVISTLGKNGAPQVTPVYYVYEGGKLLISVTKDRVKTHNVLRDPRWRSAPCMRSAPSPLSRSWARRR